MSDTTDSLLNQRRKEIFSVLKKRKFDTPDEAATGILTDDGVLNLRRLNILDLDAVRRNAVEVLEMKLSRVLDPLGLVPTLTHLETTPDGAERIRIEVRDRTKSYTPSEIVNLFKPHEKQAAGKKVEIFEESGKAVFYHDLGLGGEAEQIKEQMGNLTSALGKSARDVLDELKSKKLISGYAVASMGAQDLDGQGGMNDYQITARITHFPVLTLSNEVKDAMAEVIKAKYLKTPVGKPEKTLDVAVGTFRGDKHELVFKVKAGDDKTQADLITYGFTGTARVSALKPTSEGKSQLFFQFTINEGGVHGSYNANAVIVAESAGQILAITEDWVGDPEDTSTDGNTFSSLINKAKQQVRASRG